jgi:hypothetical protein
VASSCASPLAAAADYRRRLPEGEEEAKPEQAGFPEEQAQQMVRTGDPAETWEGDCLAEDSAMVLQVTGPGASECRI